MKVISSKVLNLIRKSRIKVKIRDRHRARLTGKIENARCLLLCFEFFSGIHLTEKTSHSLKNWNKLVEKRSYLKSEQTYIE